MTKGFFSRSGVFTNYRRVYSHAWQTYGQSWHVRISFALQFVGRICKLIMLPLAISIILARLSIADFSGAFRGAWLYVTFSFALGVLTPLVKYIGMLGENTVYKQTTMAYFDRLIHIDLSYFSSNLSGYLATSTKQYTDNLIDFIRALRGEFMNTVLSILLPLVVIFFVDWLIGLIALVVNLIQIVYLLWSSNAIGPYRTRAREVYKRNSGVMADAISNILAIRSAAQEDRYVEKMGVNSEEEIGIFRTRYAVQSKYIAVREAITVFIYALLLWLVVWRMQAGLLDITGAILIVTYIATILTGIYIMSEHLDRHDDLVDGILPAFDIFDRVDAIQDPAEPSHITTVRGEIVLKDVSFTYHKERADLNILTKFSLTIPSGQKIGIVGMSGAGKSTLAKLILRFQDVSGGSVLLDGVDIRKLRQQDLRKNIAYVPQEPILFHASIRENLLLGRADAKNEELLAALTSAHAMSFVGQLPHGIDTIVGERGVKLSGGQKQRIAIARALLQNAPIMLFDEATSALDSESEYLIKESFNSILHGRTAIVIAHRLSTLSDMDRIIVIENGQIAEDGTHSSLLNKNGLYARMWSRQQRHEDVEDVPSV